MAREIWPRRLDDDSNSSRQHIESFLSSRSSGLLFWGGKLSWLVAFQGFYVGHSNGSIRAQLTIAAGTNHSRDSLPSSFHS